MKCYVGLGSNLDEPLNQVHRAIEALRQHPAIHLLRRSPWYGSKAVGPGDQPDYVNGVIELETSLKPEALLTVLQGIEQAQGRVRELRWGARTLDLDILLYGDLCHNTPDLQIPHPRLAERAFVLAPLADLAPDLTLPAISGKAPHPPKSATIAALWASQPREGIEGVWRLAGESGPLTLKVRHA